MSRRVELPRRSRAPRSKPKLASSVFDSLLQTPGCAMVEPPVSYLYFTVPTAACEMALVFRSTGCAYSVSRLLYLRASSPAYTTFSALAPL